MFNAIFPSKDNTITNVSIKGISRTGSNTGASEILELYVLTSSLNDRGTSRVLMYFDISSISSSISQGLIPSSSVEYRLFLKNSDHYDTVPYSFDLEICPLSQTWAEGRGLNLYDEGLKDYGYSNWSQATSLTNWSISGASYISSSLLTASQYFETGNEDLNVNISNIMNAWLTGGLPNYGLIIKFPQSYETAGSDFYVKKFYSRNVHSTERTPKIISLWEKVVQDDRKNIYYNVSGSLFYYRFLNGVADNLTGPVYVNILNSSSAVVQTITASRYSDGVYQASGVLVSHTSSTSIFRDIWFSGTTQYFTGNFIPSFATGSQYYDYDNFTLDIPNLREYRKDERVIVRVFIREKDYRPALVSYASASPVPLFMKDAYYQILNEETEEVIVDFSTGSLKYSKLSYDENGNYFEMMTNSFKPEYLYKIRILVNHKGQTQVFDKGFNFKINT